MRLHRKNPVTVLSVSAIIYPYKKVAYFTRRLFYYVGGEKTWHFNTELNRHLARSILRQSWGKFREMLEYKCKKYGKILIKVNPAYTSRICSKCGKDTGKKPLSVREWDYPFCEAHHDRDINASINILLKGLAQL